MNTTLVAFLCLAMPLAALAGDNPYKVKYDEGSIADAKAGSQMKLFIDSTEVRLIMAKGRFLAIPASAITEISYGQDAHQRVEAAIGIAAVSLAALAESNQHYIGLTWGNGDKKGGFAIRCDKNDYQGVLAGLEGVTGKKAVDTNALMVKN